MSTIHRAISVLSSIDNLNFHHGIQIIARYTISSTMRTPDEQWVCNKIWNYLTWTGCYSMDPSRNHLSDNIYNKLLWRASDELWVHAKVWTVSPTIVSENSPACQAVRPAATSIINIAARIDTSLLDSTRANTVIISAASSWLSNLAWRCISCISDSQVVVARSARTQPMSLLSQLFLSRWSDSIAGNTWTCHSIVTLLHQLQRLLYGY